MNFFYVISYIYIQILEKVSEIKCDKGEDKRDGEGGKDDIMDKTQCNDE